MGSRQQGDPCPCFPCPVSQVAAFYKLGMMGEEADSDATRRDFTKHVPVR